MSSHALTHSSHVDNFAREHLPPSPQWPEFLFDRSELQYPELLNVTSELVDAHVAKGLGNRPALHGHDGHAPFTWSYATLQQQIDRIAHVLMQDMHLVAGNRLLLRGANTPMMAACFLAGLKAGLVMVPTMPLLRAAELNQVIKKARITAALCADNLADELM